MLDSAIAFAALAHAGQKRKYTGEPYICHPIEVMTIVHRYHRDDEDMLVAAVLHDVLEDCPVFPREIERRFGSAVLDMVVGLTEVPIVGNRATRKAAERDRLAEQPPAVQTIKCADLISNTKSITQHDPKFAKVYLAEKRELHAVLTKADKRLRDQVWELCRA